MTSYIKELLGLTTLPTSPPVTTTREPIITQPTTTVGGVGRCCTPDGLHPHERDCNYFYNCHSNIAHLTQCPPGLSFNAAGKYCDWHNDNHCKYSC